MIDGAGNRPVRLSVDARNTRAIRLYERLGFQPAGGDEVASPDGASRRRRVLSGLQFPFRFDPELLRADLAKVCPGEWRPHYNDADYGGQWRGAALRSPLGAPGDLSAQPAHRAPFAATPLLDRCPYFQQVLAAFPCPLKSVRLLALAPGAFIREHTDNGLDYQDGEIRIHIPVQTNPGVEFYVAGERLRLDEGGCYYVNVNLPHRVNNRGVADRIHLVIDAEVNEWVRELFANGREIPRCPLPPRGFEEFRARVIQSKELLEKLHRISDRHAFAARVVEAGRETGYEFTEADVGASLERSAVAPQGWMPVKVHFRRRSGSGGVDLDGCPPPQRALLR